MAGHHDLGYKLLFAHPELVRELLSGFTPFTWLGELEVAAFERVNPGYVSDRLSERQDDIVWRARIGDRWMYLYILLEFQSGVDRWMALRMQVYIGLLYQDLVKRGELAPADMLPPVLPVVFYNGAPAWSASLGLSSLIMDAPEGLAAFQASQQYFLIDQRGLDAASLATKHSVLALLFRLELSDLPDVVSHVLPTLAVWLEEDAQAPLRRDVGIWVERLIKKQFKGAVEFIAWEGKEVSAMRERKYETWADELEDRGLQRGLEQGLERGLARGREEACTALRAILMRLLVKRFKVIPFQTSARIEGAPMEELEEWINRATDVDSIDALFGPQAPPAADAIT
ncbi:MAG: Rpn family recombination-promoting nuclease/putative transposase [Pseudomonadota bacterium]